MKTQYYYTKLPFQKPMLREIEWVLQNWTITKNDVLRVTSLFFWKFCFITRTSYKELIWCTNYPKWCDRHYSNGYKITVPERNAEMSKIENFRKYSVSKANCQIMFMISYSNSYVSPYKNVFCQLCNHAFGYYEISISKFHINRWW